MAQVERGSRWLSAHRLGFSRADVRPGQWDKRAVRDGEREKAALCPQSVSERGRCETSSKVRH